jgi:hypothetical protein
MRDVGLAENSVEPVITFSLPVPGGQHLLPFPDRWGQITSCVPDNRLENNILYKSHHAL